jgi:hypothetical protein
VAARAAAGAELEPALRDVVEHRGALGDLGRVVHLWQRVEDRGDDVDALGPAGDEAGEDVVGRAVRVLVQEVVLGEEHVLEAGLVGRLDRAQLLEDRVVLGIRVALTPEVGDVVLDEDPEFHLRAPWPRLFGWEADGAVETDRGAVEVRVARELLHEHRELVGIAQAVRVWHL